MRETNAYAYKSYGQSLLWVASYFAVAVGLSLIIELIIVDFIHGNSHRTQENAVFMMVFFTPLFGCNYFHRRVTGFHFVSSCRPSQGNLEALL